jgi:hypothetical protein
MAHRSVVVVGRAGAAAHTKKAEELNALSLALAMDNGGRETSPSSQKERDEGQG